MKEKQFNETALVVLGFKLWKFNFGIGFFKTEGSPTNVTCDFKNALKYRKFLIGFYHVHPNMLNFPSNTDIYTFFTWGNALGKPIYCLIDGIDAEILDDKQTVAIGNYKFETFPMDNREDAYHYVGHAYKIGRFFLWKDM